MNELGWCEWFEARFQCEPGQIITRVTAVDRQLLLLVGVYCRLAAVMPFEGFQVSEPCLLHGRPPGK